MIDIEATKDSPAIKIMPKDWIIEISGPSYPPNALRVYEIVANWIDELTPNTSKELKIIFNYTYLNSSSKSALLEILRKIEQLVINNQNAIIEWHYLDSDEDMEELGEEFQAMFDIPFHLIASKDLS